MQRDRLGRRLASDGQPLVPRGSGNGLTSSYPNVASDPVEVRR